MPLCFINVFITICLIVLLEVYGIDLTISEFGHEFMSILVSFLVIQKLSFTLELYYDVQGHLSTMNQAAIDVTQLACSFTEHHKGDQYVQWRYEIAYHAAVLVKCTCAVIHKGGEYSVWEMAEFQQPGRGPLLLDLPVVADDKRSSDVASSRADAEFTRYDYPKELYIMGENLKSDLNLRVPIRVAQRMQSAIMKHRPTLPKHLDSIQEMQLMDRVNDFVRSYRNVRKYLVAPLPLPWAQLGRLFVFAYVFTLPFAMLSADLNLKGIQVIFLVAIMTYGFVGCELLFVELDDPFAEDPNDLPLAEEGRAAMEDIVLSLYYVDGQNAAAKLREEVPPLGGMDFYDHQVQKNRPLFPIILNVSNMGSGKKESDPLLEQS
jgi:hypothetical protein